MPAKIMALLCVLMSCAAPEFKYTAMPAMGTDALMCAVMAKIPVDSLAMTKPDFKSSYIDSATTFTCFGKPVLAPADGMVISLPRAARYNGYGVMLDTLRITDSAARVDIRAYVDTVRHRDSINAAGVAKVLEYKARHKSDFFRGTAMGAAVAAGLAAVLAIVIAVTGR